jgi:hypothetical protein
LDKNGLSLGLSVDFFQFSFFVNHMTGRRVAIFRREFGSSKNFQSQLILANGWAHPCKILAVSPYSACAAISGPTGTGFSQVRPLNQVDALYHFLGQTQSKQDTSMHPILYKEKVSHLYFGKATVDYNDYK